jgi:hypothetical protein
MQNFRTWLITQHKRKDAIGDLARDFAADLSDQSPDPDEPRPPARLTPVSARAYLQRRHVPLGALRTLDAAVTEWSCNSIPGAGMRRFI